ncbi:sialidase-3-like [Rhineura floridana]|uniref:sialidase-3-like n=1 Tax=Rhineura floridana TaxID=261503 RepID=UPI002AC875F2|nr:sialidase-3-like [Rhineura floridana]
MTEVGSEKLALFRQETPGGLTYRIPALLYLPSESTFLAFAEERSSPRDEDAKFLVMRRGRKKGTSVQWGPQQSLMTATLPNHRTMNPCPVYERKHRIVFLFFICVETHVTERHQITSGRNAARLCYVLSQDGGRTWSQTTDLTEQVIGNNVRNWATFAVGPGHGLQLSSGRLVIPAYTYYIHKRCFGHALMCWTKPHCFTFYSDDSGRTWSLGQLLDNLRTTECQVAELTRQDNSQVLYCNARSPDRFRAEAFSMDSGDRFEESFLCKELHEPPNGCQGSVVSFFPQLEPGVHSSSASLKSTKSWLIFSHPTNRHKRIDLGIYLNTSPLERDSWRSPWVLYKGPSSYSDLAVCQEGNLLLFGCLFESGVFDPSEEIAFQLFTNAELRRNVRDS